MDRKRFQDFCARYIIYRIDYRKMPEFSVVLVEPLYGGNIGSVARLIMNFGIKDLVLAFGPSSK